MTSLESHPGSPALPTHIRESIDEALARRPKGWMPRTRHRNGAQPRFANRLTLETSPYLQQHAHNPVNWFPWGEEAFEVARQTNRPVFLSIGYSTCHWCHVMEEESFEDLEIAEYLNTHFVPIKLDREERPDVDAIYMAVTQAVSGHGGWPMSVWMTADAEPFYAGTYYPPRDGVRRGSTGFLTLLRRIDELWRTRKSDLTAQARTFVKGVQEQLGAREGAAALLDTRVTDDIARLIDHLYDDRSGGIARAPKFPSNVPVRLLLRVHRRTGSARALHMATHTLEHMAAGGLYDQLGGGFHRYSTDGDWLVPHFEKMLYDQALLTLAYTEAWQVTRREDFARVVREVLDYVQREMTAPEGGFYSATDADSEGEEGLFFVWEQSEIDQALPPDTAERFIRHYGVTATGNFEGRNILHVAHPSETEWQALRQARATLLALRQTRKPPLLDDKVLASWNGLMISAFASAGRTFDEPAWTTTASRAARFVLTRMREDGRLKRSFKDGRALHPGFLDDYAFLLAGLLDLFEATCDSDWVREATSLADVLERHYADTERGGWFMTSDDHERLLVREKPTYDGAEPSGGSVATLAFLRLGALTGDARWTNAGLRALESYGATATEQPLAQTELALAIEFLAGPPLEVVVAAPGENDALHKTLRTAFAPHVVRIAGNDAALEKASDLVAAARDRLSRGTPTAWVCSDGACLLPVHEPQALLKLLAPSGV